MSQFFGILYLLVLYLGIAAITVAFAVGAVGGLWCLFSRPCREKLMGRLQE